MADHGLITIVDFNPSPSEMQNVNIQTSIDSAVNYAGTITIVNNPVLQTDRVYVSQFGIAGTGADAGTNSNATATTGQLFPYAIDPRSSD